MNEWYGLGAAPAAEVFLENLVDRIRVDGHLYTFQVSIYVGPRRDTCNLETFGRRTRLLAAGAIGVDAGDLSGGQQ